jgi:hypothetical protein
LTPRRRAQRPSERPATDITADKESFGLISAVGSVFSVMNKVANSVPGIITHPVRKLKDSLLSSNHGEEETAHSEDGAEPMTLEGLLYYKKGGRGGRPFKWKKRFVRLDMVNGGSISVYRAKDEGAKKVLQQMYTTLKMNDDESKSYEGPTRDEDVCLRFPVDCPWVVKDVFYDPRMFAIEVPTSADNIDDVLLQPEDNDNEDDGDNVTPSLDRLEPSLSPVEEDPAELETFESSVMGETLLESQLVDELQDEIMEAQQLNKKRLRFYFKCVRTGNEKALWLRAFAKIDRMSSHSSRKGKVIGSVAKAVSSNTRIRSETSASFARETRQLDRASSGHKIRSAVEDASGLHNTASGKEFRVVPTYAYPHRWMTSAELREEMLLPSAHFHDLRLPSKRGEEIGTLRVEVLQCLGLPKLDRVSETDAVCYLVCGSYAFNTDVIMDCASPMWLRKTRRACIFPIFHGYARLYVGVFDDDGFRAKDDLAGRICIDLARLRPGSQYDVTIPLRMSTHVYSRRKRGSIRLRFTLDWKDERSALLSYLPKTLPTPKTMKPNTDCTVVCCDEKAFRNVAITVHGAHLPGRFSPKHFRSLLREINFSRKLMMIMVREQVRGTILWKNPTISAFVFGAWMHCIYANQFSLAPAYFLVFLIIHMVQNYAKYGMDGPLHEGFVPLSCEEMLFALLRGNNAKCFAPLELEYLGPSGQNPSYICKTHEHWGKNELRWLGLGPTKEEMDEMNVDEEHMEFAFAPGKDYPRFTVEESIVHRPSKSKSKKQAESGLLTGGTHLSQKFSIADYCSAFYLTNSHAASSQIFRGNARPLDFDISDEVFTEDVPSDGDRDIPRSGSYDLLEEVLDTFENNDCADSKIVDEAAEIAAYAKLPPRLRIPQQDMDKAGGAGNDKSVMEDITEVKMKLHDLTLQQFNDQAYVIRDTNVSYFGQSQNRKKKTEDDVSKQLDKLLGLGQYSNGNVIVSKISPYVEPIIGGANSFICLFRCLFNMFTWRDPFLSFWVTVITMIVAGILFVFPWRIVLFLAGLVLVGPQVSLMACTLRRYSVLVDYFVDSLSLLSLNS